MGFNARYIRHYPLIGIDGQSALQKSRVLVVGCGGIGTVVAPYLAGAGIGTLGLVDDDDVSLSNLHRQLLYTQADIGKQKVSCAATRLEQINDEITITRHSVRLTKENAASIIGNYTFVIDGSDNFTTRYLVNDICCQLRIPLISASVLDNQWQVGLFDCQTSCYRCVYPEAPPADYSPSCSEAGVLGPTVGMVASYSAALALRYFIDKTSLPYHQLYRFDILEGVFDTFTFTQDKRCPACVKQCVTPSMPVASGAVLHGVQPTGHLERYCIVDVRESWELSIAAMPNATHIPLRCLDEHYEQLAKKAKPILLLCKTGKRSAQALLMLRQKKVDAYQLTGGITAWMNAHGKTLPY